MRHPSAVDRRIDQMAKHTINNDTSKYLFLLSSQHHVTNMSARCAAVLAHSPLYSNKDSTMYHNGIGDTKEIADTEMAINRGDQCE
nr:hypothetical protein CFP56_24271 [Quercus suber]